MSNGPICAFARPWISSKAWARWNDPALKAQPRENQLSRSSFSIGRAGALRSLNNLLPRFNLFIRPKGLSKERNPRGRLGFIYVHSLKDLSRDPISGKRLGWVSLYVLREHSKSANQINTCTGSQDVITPNSWFELICSSWKRSQRLSNLRFRSLTALDRPQRGFAKALKCHSKSWISSVPRDRPLKEL